VNQVGRYQILEELGRGACGVVYRALDPAIGRTVAIKSIRFSEFSDPDERRDLRERVLREAQSAGKLSHPNIVTIYDVLESNELAYIFMEFVDGSSLKDAMKRDALPAREQVISILRQLAEALDYAHRKGIIHRDIKPANIMISERGVDKDGLAKIADFGVAKLISQEATHQRAFMGTPSYMSPEQLEGVPVGGASDQFALGVVVYELLTGAKPFAAENLAALHYLICKRPAKPVNESNPTLSETVNRVMERVLAKLPEDRYSSCSEFMGALTVALGECPEWLPVAPPKVEGPAKASGNGWYSPETVVSSRLIEAKPADYSITDEAVEVLDPDVLPPEPNRLETALSTRVISDQERAELVGEPERKFEPRSNAGTRIRVGLERPAANSWGWIIAACVAIALAGIFLLRSFYTSKASAPGLEANRIVNSRQPEDLTTNGGGKASTSAPPADLTVGNQTGNPVATPISTDSDSSRTTVAVRAPSPRQEPTTMPTAPLEQRPAVEKPVALPPQPLKAVRQVPAHVAVPTPSAQPVIPQASSVELVSDPAGAQIEVDGRSDSLCLAPCSVSLGPGRHTLSAQASGYGTARKIFTVPVSGSVFVSLGRNTGTMLLTSEPAGADVVIDGKEYGPTPVRVRLSAGRHHLSVSDGNRHHDETIQIDTDGMYARSFRW
jgi:serine/threonine protein kinase